MTTTQWVEAKVWTGRSCLKQRCVAGQCELHKPRNLCISWEDKRRPWTTKRGKQNKMSALLWEVSVVNWMSFSWTQLTFTLPTTSCFHTYCLLWSPPEKKGLFPFTGGHSRPNITKPGGLEATHFSGCWPPMPLLFWLFLITEASCCPPPFLFSFLPRHLSYSCNTPQITPDSY